MTPLIFVALAALVGLPPHTGRLAVTSATETTAKTPRDGPKARGGLISKLKPAAPLDPLVVAGDVELFAACLAAGLSVHGAATAVARTADAQTQDLWETVSALLGVGVSTQSACCLLYTSDAADE